MVVLHVIVALAFALVGLGYAVALGLSGVYVLGLYGLCGALGLVLSVSAAMALSDMSVWARKRARGG